MDEKIELFLAKTDVIDSRTDVGATEFAIASARFVWTSPFNFPTLKLNWKFQNFTHVKTTRTCSISQPECAMTAEYETSTCTMPNR